MKKRSIEEFFKTTLMGSAAVLRRVNLHPAGSRSSFLTFFNTIGPFGMDRVKNQIIAVFPVGTRSSQWLRREKAVD